MLTDLLLFVTSAVLGGIAFVAVRQRDAARREAARNARLAEVGAAVEGLAHDLNNIFTSIPFFVEETLELDDEQRCMEAQRELEATLEAGSMLLQELQRCVDGKLSDDGGSVAGFVRLVAAGLRFRGARIVTRLDCDTRYGPGDLELLDAVRDVMTSAVHDAAELEDGVVRVDLGEDRLSIEHARPGALEEPARTRRVGSTWTLRRRVRTREDAVSEVRVEFERSPADAES
jgi:hypothetical protein